MADVSYFNLSEPEFHEHDDQFDVFTSPSSDINESYGQNDLISDRDLDLITTVDLFDRGNQVNFVMDLFQERVEQSHVVGNMPDLVSGLGFVEMGSDCLELDLGLGLGSGVDKDDDIDNFGFMVAESDVRRTPNTIFGSEFGSDDDDEDGGEISTICGSRSLLTGIQGIGFESESELDDEIDLIGGFGLFMEDDFESSHVHYDDDDMGVNICWDSLQLEENHEASPNDDLEWEEVDGRVEERDFMSMRVGDINVEEEVNVVMIGGLMNVGWEVLLDVDGLERNQDLDRGFDPDDDYIYTAEYEVLVGQFAENENASIGRPPASKSAVENLPTSRITQKDVDDNNVTCAVCKDEMNVDEHIKQLPCLHRYHGECILPWLGIRNTCPVCRYELPTDDADYERRRTERAGRGM